MAELFQRAYRLICGTTEIDARAGVSQATLRIAFSVERSERRTPNAVEVRIWNLNPAHRAALHSSTTVPVSLEAGYVSGVGAIFVGDLRSARTRREGADLVTYVTGGDGEAAIRTARINRTFPAGTPVTQVLKGLADALGISAGNANSVSLSGRLAKARTLSGLVYDQLEAFTKTQGLRWSIQDSALQIREGDAPVADRTGPLLRADSGLIGTPEVESQAQRKQGAMVQTGTQVSGTTLLRPDLVPGVAYRVESPGTFDGNLVCIQCSHVGDSHSSDWYTQWVGRPY